MQKNIDSITCPDGSTHTDMQARIWVSGAGPFDHAAITALLSAVVLAACHSVSKAMKQVDTAAGQQQTALKSMQPFSSGMQAPAQQLLNR